MRTVLTGPITGSDVTATRNRLILGGALLAAACPGVLGATALGDPALVALTALATLPVVLWRGSRNPFRQGPALLVDTAAAASLTLLALTGRPTAAVAMALVYPLGTMGTKLAFTRRALDATSCRLADALKEQARMAVTDQLTGLHNRSFFEELLTLETARTLRAGTSMGLLTVELDHAGRLSDTHGRDVGGRALVEMAARLRQTVRACDVVARYGDKQLIVLLPGAEEEALMEVGRRFCAALAEQPLNPRSGLHIEVTVSVGAALLPRDAVEPMDLVRVAERALLKARADGGNRMEMGADSGVETPARRLEMAGALSLLESLAESLEEGASGDDHALQTAELASLVAARLELDPDVAWSCVAAARVHDVGKLKVPESILRKPGPLTPEEWDVIRHHPGWGAEIVGLRPELAAVARAVREHHERFDGGGYPMGRRGEEICIQARVIAVCDAWSTMRTSRPYRDAISIAEAEAELRAGASGQFDPQVVDALLALVAEASAVAA